MFRTPFRFTLAVLCLVSTLRAQEPAPKEQSSKESLQIQFEFQAQRVRLLKTQVQLMKEIQAVEVQQARLRINSRKLERKSLQNQIEAASANLQALKRNYQRTEQLHERGVITERDLEKARLDLTKAEFEHKQVVTTAEYQEQKVNSEELELKRLELEGASKVNETQLGLLEAEFQLKELELALKKK